MGLSIWLSLPWYRELSQVIGTLAAYYLITFIAIIPGFINAFVVASLLFDKRPIIRANCVFPPVTVLIAAYNEENSIADTLECLFKQEYPAEIHVVAIDDGSIDKTAQELIAFLPQYPNLKLINLKQNSGKATALNFGLEACTTDIVITLDADTYLLPDAIHNLVGRYLSDPSDTKAVAGEILIRNSRENWITKAQEWDYFLGIAATKRIQSLFKGTLVAQGAFSLYDRTTLVEMGGWPNMVGEDIVLTWKILNAGYRVGHAHDACAFTNCPNTFIKFFRQRKRWSRGLIEAFKENPLLPFKARLSTIYIWWNALFPLMDLAYTIGFIPGIVLACFGKFWIVGPMTLALLPFAIFLSAVMYLQSKAMFKQEHLEVRSNALGLILYVLVYGLLLQPASVLGYIAELFKLKKGWGTK
ncbi:MAG: hypothetical protein K0R08_39 [Solimicrobium sp.]|jgi:biofilm PGA synthesis N-glycosyltransferase PgaC|nr:hypothetical protein [Solimicrobium sp.]